MSSRRSPLTEPGPSAIVDAAPEAAAVVKSAGRVLKIFEFFDEVQREARVGEISRQLGFPQSSTSVLLRSLVQMGYLDFDATTRAFVPTPRVALLGSWISHGLVRDGALIRLMNELSDLTGETITLAVRNDIYAQYIRVHQATNAIRLHVPIGTRRLLVWSAAGFALLSGTDDDEIHALVRRTNVEALPGQRRIDARQVLAHVEQFRQHGYFFSRELVTPGGGHIAMRLPDGIGRRERPLAIGISGWLANFERLEARFVRLMRDAVRRYIEPAQTGIRQARQNDERVTMRKRRKA